MIHSTAIIDPSAQLDDTVEVGPYSIIGANVVIGARTKIGPHVVIQGPTRIGEDNHIFQFASVGEACQDLKYKGEPTRLEIGDRNTIREFVTMQRGTIQDNSLTKVGDDNLFMAYTHVAHDCVIGNKCIFANLAQIAGHVKIADHVILGGNTSVHQFVQIGAHVMTGIGSVVFKDIPAFILCHGSPATPASIHSEGLKRRGFSSEQIQSLKQAYKIVYRQGLTVDDALQQLANLADQQVISLFSDSIQRSTRGIIR